MKKLYPVIFLLGCLLCQNLGFAQQTPCAVSIKTNTNNTQLDCRNTSITLTAYLYLRGNLPVTYVWSTGDTLISDTDSESSITVTQGGFYEVTATGGNCYVSNSIIITENTIVPAVSVQAFPDTVCSGDSATLVATGADSYQWKSSSSTSPFLTVAPTSSTPYIVTGTAANGCIGIDSINLFVNPLPDASIRIINSSSCQYNTINPPKVILKGANGKMPYTFAYTVNGIPAQPVTTTGSDSVVISVPTDQSDITYQLTSVTDSNGCLHAIQGPQAVVSSYIFPSPTLTSKKDTTVCSGTPFNYTATSNLVPGSVGFNWTRPFVSGILPSSNSSSGAIINETLTNTTSQPIIVNYFLTSTTGACTKVDTVRVTVNPTPSLISIQDTTVCSGSLFTYNAISSAQGTFFNWTRPAVAGISPATPDNGSGATINDILTNTTSQPITVEYIFSLSTTGNCSQTDTVKMIVNSVPSLISTKDTNNCSGSPFVYTAVSSVSPTHFTWSRAAVAGISTAANSGSGASINETLTNATTRPVKVTYIIMLTLEGGCSETETVQVTVNPIPSLTNTKDTSACSGALFTYTAISLPGTGFSWIRPSVSGISNPPGSSASPTISETLTNTTLLPDTVNYIYTLTLGGGCSKIDTLRVVVNPIPALVSKNKDTVCSGSVFIDTAVSSIGGTTFTWSRAAVAGISTTANSGSTATINEILINTTSQPVAVKYILTLTKDGCSSMDSIQVSVKPALSLISTKDTSLCSTEPLNYQPRSSVTGTTFTWTRPAVTGISPETGSGSGDRITETLTNLGATIITVKYVLTLTKDGCSSTDSIKVSVKPAPVITNISDRAFCNGETVSEGIPFNSSSPQDSITWVSNEDFGLGYTTGTGNIPVFTATNAGSTPKKARVSAKVVGGPSGCTSANFPFIVTVDATPEITRISDTAFCNGDSARNGIRFAGSAPNASIHWQSDNDFGLGYLKDTGNIPPFLATNTDNSMNHTATVTVGISDSLANSSTRCFGASTTFKIIVNPTPFLISARDTILCSRSPLDYKPRSSVSGAAFTWIRIAVPEILLDSGSGSGNIIIDTLINRTGMPVTVTYFLSFTTVNGCSNTDSVKVTVNPAPLINPVSSYTFCNNELVSNGIPFSSPTPNTSFKWRSSADVGFGTQDTGIIKPFTAINSSTMTTSMDTVIATAIGNNGCGADTTFIVAVNPSPQITRPADTSFCGRDSVSHGIIFSSSTPNTSFVWSSNINVGFPYKFNDNVDTGSGIMPFQAIQGPVAAPVSVRAFSKSTSCSSGDSTFIITVYPSPAQIHFTSLSGTSPNGSPLLLCDSSENINFNVSSSQSDLNGIAYYWTSTLDSPRVNIKNPNYPNTVISFNDIGTSTITVTAKYQNTACVSTASQIVTVTDRTIDVSRQKIFKKNPGNLLIYPDNSLPGSIDSTSGYQWGYDKVLLPDTLAVSESHAVPGQIYQFYTPEPASCNCIEGDTLNTKDFYYWVLLKDGKGCSTKVYYNGPFDDKQDGVRLPNPVTSIQLRVIPNPNRGVFDVSVKGNMYGNIEAQVYSSAGQLVFRKKFVKSTPDATEKFITGALPAGTYFLVLRSSDLKQAHSHFIISR